MTREGARPTSMGVPMQEQNNSENFTHDSFHVAVASIQTVRLGIAIVEAAGAVIVRAVKNRIHALRRVAYGRPANGVVAVAGARRHEDAVRLLAVQRGRRADRAGEVVVAVALGTLEAAGRRLREVVPAAGLVVDDGDEAGRAGAEGVLRGGVGHAAGGQRRDGGRGIVGAALHLVERAAEGAVQGARGAVRGDAGRAASGVDVAGPGDDEGARGHKA